MRNILRTDRKDNGAGARSQRNDAGEDVAGDKQPESERERERDIREEIRG